MNYVKNLNICGTDIKEIPCIKGNGAPGSDVGGAVGLLYMDVDSGEMYKCTLVKGGVSTWAPVADVTYVDESIQTAILDSWGVGV